MLCVYIVYTHVYSIYNYNNKKYIHDTYIYIIYSSWKPFVCGLQLVRSWYVDIYRTWFLRVQKYSAAIRPCLEQYNSIINVAMRL